MNCPECGIKLRNNATECSCGWSSYGASAKGQIKWAVCHGCQKELPWPSHKQEKADHRIIGRTSRNQPVCNVCHSRSPEWDWRDDCFREFQERHKNDNWNVLIQMSYALKGAPKEDCVEFMGYLREEMKKRGGVFGKLPYDPTKREPA